MKSFERAGWSWPVSRRARDYLPGDVVAWDLGRGILDIGIAGDVASDNGSHHVIHNFGAGVREEDILFRYRIIGHYRPPPAVATR